MPHACAQALSLLTGALCFPLCVAFCALVAAARQGCKRCHTATPSRPRVQQGPRQVVVLIPAFNAASTVGAVLGKCMADPLVSHVFVVDGGSRDETAQIVRNMATVEGHTRITLVHMPPGVQGSRANCQNLAACAAAAALRPRALPRSSRAAAAAETAGETAAAVDGSVHGHGHGRNNDDDDAYYAFLHADTVPPPGFGATIADILADSAVSVGAFGISRTHRQVGVTCWLAFADWLNNVRAKWMETPYGDALLFCRQSTFEAVGGFPALPLMEDSAFVWRARQLGRVRVASKVVRTAAGQYSRLGMLYVMRNYLLLTLWIARLATPAAIHAFYYPGRPLPVCHTYEALLAIYSAQAGNSDVGRASAERQR